MIKKISITILIIIYISIANAVIITKKGYNTTLQFDSNVEEYMLGNKIYFKTIKKNKNFIFLNPKSADYQTNITVILANGEVKDLIIRGIKYEIKRRRKLGITKKINYKRLHNFSKSEAGKTKNNANTKGSSTIINTDKKISQTEKNKYKNFLKKYKYELKTTRYSIVQSKIYATAMKTIKENKLVYIPVKITNKSSNKYKIFNNKTTPEAYLRKYNKGLLGISKNIVSNVPLKDKIIDILLPEKSIVGSGNVEYIIYVIKQFGISSNNYLRFEIIEQNGNRNITLEAKWESIN